MTLTTLALAATFSSLLALILLQQSIARRQTRQRQQALQHALVHSLELLQRLQKHRGLGGQNSSDARNQCRNLALELDNLWRSLPGAAGELTELQPAWQALQQHAGDFDGHCRLIERLLTLIQLFELRLSGPLQSDLGIARSCRELEELARLRGLAVRGANTERCPLPLQVQLRYLSLRLQSRASRNTALARALDSLRRQLIDPPRVAIAPAECFNLLTPLIDEQLGQLRQRLA